MEKDKISQKSSINNNNKKLLRQSSLIITEEEKNLFFNTNNNYIEYFIEIGIKPQLLFQEEIYKSNSLEEINKKLNPEIISKFPNFDKNSSIIDNIIIKTVFPKGFKCLESKIKPDLEYYSIILDNQLCSTEYIHKYISCLIIYENILNYINLYNKYSCNKINDKTKLDILKQYYVPKCLGIVSLFPYVDKYEEILRSLYEIFLSKNSINLLIEEIIMKLVIEIPKVPKGIKRVILKLPNKSIELTESKMNELPYLHFNLSQAIGHFNLENLIDIYTYLLIETKMIFFSNKIKELSNTILSFLFLLSPLKYQYQIVSVLPKELFSFCKSLSPFIFGINDNFYPHFFSKNKIDIEDSTICVVDIDSGKYYMIAPGSELDEKEYPKLPKHLRDKIENKIQKYYQKLKNDSSKKNNIKEDNKKYQKMFYNFMLYLFKDYPKFLNLDYGVSKTIKMHIKYLIDLEGYIKSRVATERDFYQKVLNTQMFIEFIYKRMMPKDCSEKIEALFFEEKINSKKIKKNIFGMSNIKEKNYLLSSKDYDYDKKIGEIIDLSNLTINSKEIIKYLNEYRNKNINLFNKDCLYKGIFIEKNKNDNKLKFNYYLFPILFNERIYKVNKNNFHPGKSLYQNFEKINSKIVNKIHLKYEHRKKIINTEIENDNYLSYIIIWSLSFWYTDKEERQFRFNQMLEVLDKIEEHDIEIFEILFENVVKFGTEENILFLYKKFIAKKFNPSWKIFSLVSKYLKSNMMSKSQTNLFYNKKEEQILSKSNSNRSLKKKKDEQKKINPIKFRLRTLKNLEIDENIFSNDIEFVAYNECKYCKKIINLANLCSNLSTTLFKADKKTECDKIKCPNKLKNNKYCDRYSEQKLAFQFGVELFNQYIENESTCSLLFVPLISPTSIKKKLLSISNLHKNTNFDVELFKKKYSTIFWNCLWYFQLNNMDISFMLPYVNNIKIINSKLFSTLKFYNESKYEIKFIKDKNDKNSRKIIEKLEINKYKNQDLCKQIIFQFSIIKDMGLINYISNLYKENIEFNEFPLINETNETNNNEGNFYSKKEIRASFWFSSVDRIIDKSSENKDNINEKDINDVINEFDFEDDEIQNFINRTEIDLNDDENNYMNNYSKSFNFSFKRRGTLSKGVYEEEKYLQNISFDFGE